MSSRQVERRGRARAQNLHLNLEFMWITNNPGGCMDAKTSSRGISWLISAAEMIFLLCGAQVKMDRGGNWGGGESGRGLAGRQRELQGDVGTVLQHSPRQEAMKGVGTERSGGDREPLSILQTHTYAHARTHSHTLYHQLSINHSG